MSRLEPVRAKRKRTARELAAQFGVHPSTIRRAMSQPREEYLAEAAARHERIRAARAGGLSMRAIAEQEGITPGAVHYALHKDDPPTQEESDQA